MTVALLAIPTILILCFGREIIRYTVWTVRCRRGRRCANVDEVKAAGDLPPGVVSIVTYRCGGCGTVYRSEAILGNDGCWTTLDRVRIG